VRAGIQSLPRGQRYAGLAMGFTLPQTYRYVLLPMAFRIVIPPLTSESMNIVKNSSVAFAVSIAELTMFAMQAQEETSRGIEIYLAVTGCTSSRPSPSTASWPFIEKRVRVPGMIGGGRGQDEPRLLLPQLGGDLQLRRQGLHLQLQLTLVAMVGGIVSARCWR
jgi:glutamate/aspartate transport system permease protein